MPLKDQQLRKMTSASKSKATRAISTVALCLQIFANPVATLSANIAPQNSAMAPSLSGDMVAEVTPPAMPYLEDQEKKIAIVEPSVVEKANKAIETMNKINLPPVSRQIAEKLDLIPTIIELDDLRNASEFDLPAQLKRLKLKQKLNQEVLIVTLQVRDAAAKIDRQISILNRQRGFLEDGRNRAGRLNSIANVISNGVMQEIGQAGEMKVNEIPGEELELVAGGLTIVLGTLALKQQSGKKQVVKAKPNLLAKVFDRPTDDEAEYPPIVWWYMNTAAPGAPSTQTRRQDLLDRWRRYGVFSGNNKPAENRRMASLSNTNHQAIVTIDLLSDQASLLAEVKSEIYQLDHDLLQLLLGVQAL